VQLYTAFVQRVHGTLEHLALNSTQLFKTRNITSVLAPLRDCEKATVSVVKSVRLYGTTQTPIEQIFMKFDI
jgi:hypothetical protein